MTNIDSIRDFVRRLGPGLLFAGAAIGGSHLVQSTRAGAAYGFSLLGIVIVANILKYPFFEYGQRYAASTGKSLLEGYRQIGKPVLYLFFALTFLTAIVNTAAVTMVTAGLLGNIIGLGWGIVEWSACLLVVTTITLFIGEYSWLDHVVKVIIVLLSISTIAALVMAIVQGPAAAPETITPSIWNVAGISFLVALMGWMPAPIEGAVWPSLWLLEKDKELGRRTSLKEAQVDFNIGYIGTAILAMAFLGLGALVMFGSGESFSASGIKFAGQVVQLYIHSLGQWSAPIISIAALTTMLSTTLTVVDAYPRTVTGCLQLSMPSLGKLFHPLYRFWVIFVGIASFVVIRYFAKSMTGMLDFATILSFLAAPIFAYLNLKVVTDKHMPDEGRPGKKMLILSWIGIVFLSSVSLTFIIWRFFLK